MNKSGNTVQYFSMTQESMINIGK